MPKSGSLCEQLPLSMAISKKVLVVCFLSAILEILLLMFSCPSTNGLLNVSCCKEKSQPNYIFANLCQTLVMIRSGSLSLSIPLFFDSSLLDSDKSDLDSIRSNDRPNSSLWQGYTRGYGKDIHEACGYVPEELNS